MKKRMNRRRAIRVMADNYDAMGLDMLFTIINNKGDDEAENMMYMVAYGPGAEEVLFRPSLRLFSRPLKRPPDRSCL